MCFLLGPAGERGGEEGSAALPSSCPNLWTPSSYSFWWHWGPPSDGEAPRLQSEPLQLVHIRVWVHLGLSPPRPASQVSRENRGLASEPSQSKVMLTSESCASGFRLLLAPLPGTNGFQISPFSPTDNAAWLFLVQCILLPLASADALSPPEPVPRRLVPLPHPGLEEVRLLRSQPFLSGRPCTHSHTLSWAAQASAGLVTKNSDSPPSQQPAALHDGGGGLLSRQKCPRPSLLSEPR